MMSYQMCEMIRLEIANKTTQFNVALFTYWMYILSYKIEFFLEIIDFLENACKFIEQLKNDNVLCIV